VSVINLHSNYTKELPMETKTVRDVIEDLKAEYQRHFGEPHSNKAYAEQSKNLKALITAVGSHNIIDTWVFLLRLDDDWYKTKKNIPSLIRWYDELQGMMLEAYKGKKGSLSEKLLGQDMKAQVKLDAFRKEMLNE